MNTADRLRLIAKHEDNAIGAELIKAASELEALERRVSDETIRGMLTRLEREHHQLRADWENETGKPWVSPFDEPDP